MKPRKSKLSFGEKAGLTAIIIWLLLIVGYLMNAWKCVSNFLDAPTIGQATTVAWVQLLGIFTGPLGSIFGFVVW